MLLRRKDTKHSHYRLQAFSQGGDGGADVGLEPGVISLTFMGETGQEWAMSLDILPIFVSAVMGLTGIFAETALL